jgi:hypothetical protein
MKCNDIALTIHGLGRQKRVRSWRRYRTWRGENSRVIIDEHSGVFVYLIPLATSALIPRTEIALWVVLRQSDWLGGFGMALPRSITPLR